MLYELAFNDVLLFICMGMVTGWLVGEFRQGQGYGLVGNAFIGIFGALFGGFLFDHFELMRLHEFGFPAFVQTAFSAFIGAAVLLFCLDHLGMKT